MLLKNCLVSLVGNLSTMPIASNEHTEMIIVATRQCHYFEDNEMKTEKYRIILSHRDARHIMLMGYPGALLSIQGDLRFKDEPEIIAKRVDFIDFPGNNQQQPEFIFNYKDNPDLQTSINLDMQQLFQNATRPHNKYLHEYCNKKF